MRRWTNGLPGATQRLGAMMTQRGLTASQPWMRADTHPGPEHNRSTSEAEYIDAALTFALSELHLAPHGRAIHLALPRHGEVPRPKPTFDPEAVIGAALSGATVERCVPLEGTARGCPCSWRACEDDPSGIHVRDGHPKHAFRGWSPPSAPAAPCRSRGAARVTGDHLAVGCVE